MVRPDDFREAAAQFPTGVTVVTTRDEDDQYFGLTVNSFSTVSLEPPLVLFCIGRDSDGFQAFAAGNGFVVHVLSADQRHLSAAFATKGIDKFSDVVWESGPSDLPVIGGALSTFECAPYASHDGGDHVIHIGRVVRLTIANSDVPALGYFRHAYFSTPEAGKSRG